LVGVGTVGGATGRGFLRLGHDVTFYDILDTKRSELRKQGYKVSDTLDFNADIIFICVPEGKVEEVVSQLPTQPLKVIRSTVPPGTTRRLQTKSYYNHVCHNPCFVREAVADYEFMNPHRIVIGQCCRAHGDLLEELYKPLRAPIVRVDPTASELIKLASNAYLATQVSFWNQIHLIAEKLGVNSHVVGKACMLDPRVSPYGASIHGEPYGGKCLPKDLEQLRLAATKLGVHTLLLDAVKEVNENMKERK
jgi:UDPglucose 6-dehydrogenase